MWMLSCFGGLLVFFGASSLALHHRLPREDARWGRMVERFNRNIDDDLSGNLIFGFSSLLIGLILIVISVVL